MDKDTLLHLNPLNPFIPLLSTDFSIPQDHKNGAKRQNERKKKVPEGPKKHWRQFQHIVYEGEAEWSRRRPGKTTHCLQKETRREKNNQIFKPGWKSGEERGEGVADAFNRGEVSNNHMERKHIAVKNAQ